MADLHIEDFYKDGVCALLQLYFAFPRRISVFVEDICGPDTVDEFGLHSKRHLGCLGAMLWLAEEGFLRYTDTIRQDAIDQAVLTQKAFLLLSAYAPATERWPAQISQAERLRDLLRHASSTQLADYARQLLFAQPH